jgi:hypothetical protein
MSAQMWYKVVVPTRMEQQISVYPNEGFDGIIVEIEEVDDNKESIRLYLYKDEMNIFIEKMMEMMKHVEGSGK